MPKRDLYRVLGISSMAPPGEIKRAYRQLAFAVHPDVGQRPDAERFREVHEAYEILGHPERRRSYDVEIAVGRRPLAAEPLRAPEPVVLTDFLTIRPSLDDLIDHVRQNFFGYRQKSGGPIRSLSAQVILNSEEARFGCRVPFSLPSYTTCPSCRGTGQWLGSCADCDGEGMIETMQELALEIPPGAQDGDLFEADFSELGIRNLWLEVRIVVI